MNGFAVFRVEPSDATLGGVANRLHEPLEGGAERSVFEDVYEARIGNVEPGTLPTWGRVTRIPWATRSDESASQHNVMARLEIGHDSVDSNAQSGTGRAEEGLRASIGSVE